MTRWGGSVPAGVSLLLLIVLIAGDAVFAQRYIRRRFPGSRTDGHNDVIKFTHGLVYAFFVGFIVSAWCGGRRNRRRHQLLPDRAADTVLHGHHAGVRQAAAGSGSRPDGRAAMSGAPVGPERAAAG